jgi:hypothetical protein
LPGRSISPKSSTFVLIDETMGDLSKTCESLRDSVASFMGVI